jgi:RNA polymerase sigma factor (sigma-70 family)
MVAEAADGVAPTGANRVVTDLVTRARDGDERAWGALVERYAPLIWSICRKHRLDDAAAEDVGQSVWLHLLDQLDRVRDPDALPGWLATTTRRECVRVLHAAQGPQAAGYVLDVEGLPDEHGRTADQELLVAERHAALRDALRDLPLCCQRLIAMLTNDPPVPYAEISTRLGIAVGGIGPTRARCLERLRRHPAITALIAEDGPGQARLPAVVQAAGQELGQVGAADVGKLVELGTAGEAVGQHHRVLGVAHRGQQGGLGHGP